MSSIAVNAITNAAGGNTATINGMTPTADSLQGFRNRLINGGMVIDQRNAGGSVTPTNGQYTVDRWSAVLTQSSKFSVQRNAGSVTPPAGFSNYLGITSLSAYSVLSGDTFLVGQQIEGFNGADLAWGTASASPITISFWVRSSLTGVFGGSLYNGARNYIFTYSISSANTWEYKTVTIAGDTSGTYNSDNNLFTQVRFGLGSGSTFSGTAGSWGASNLVQPTGAVSVVGTSGATFYITGVQLEAGSVATPFERRPYGTELALCQRYYFRMKANSTSSIFAISYNVDTASAFGNVFFPVEMRTQPSALEQSGTAGDYRVRHKGTATNCTSVPSLWYADIFGSAVVFTTGSGLTAGEGSAFRAVNTSAFLAWSAEL